MKLDVPNIDDISVTELGDNSTNVVITLDDGATAENHAPTAIWIGDDLPFGMDGWVEIQPRRGGNPVVHRTIQYSKVDGMSVREVALDTVVDLLVRAEDTDDLREAGVHGEAIAEQIERTRKNTEGLEAQL